MARSQWFLLARVWIFPSLALLWSAGCGGSDGESNSERDGAPSLVSERPGSITGIPEGEITSEPIPDRTVVLPVDGEPGGASVTGSSDLAGQPQSSRPGLAVYEMRVLGMPSGSFEGKDVGHIVSLLLLNSIDSQRYRLFERTQLAAVMEEIGLAETDLVQDGRAREALALKGVRFLLIGELLYIGDRYAVTARLVDCTSGELEPLRARVEFTRQDEIHKAIAQVVNRLGLRKGDQGEVEPPRIADTTPGLMDLSNPDPGFSLSLRTPDGKTEFVQDEDEGIRFVIKAAKSCYVTLLTRDPQGQITLLVPNRYTTQDKAFVRAGQSLTIPTTSRNAFRIAPPHGECELKLIATIRPLAIPALEPVGKGDYEDLGAETGERSQRAAREFRKAIVGEAPVGILPEDIEDLTHGYWATTSLTIITAENRLERDQIVADHDEEATSTAPANEAKPEPTDPGTLASVDPNDAILDLWIETTQTGATPKSMGLFARGKDASRSKGASGRAEIDELVVFYKPGHGPPGIKGPGGPRARESMRIVKVSRAGTKSIDREALEQRIKELEAEEGVVAVFPNFPVTFFDMPRTEFRRLQWPLRNGFAANNGKDTGWHKIADRASEIQPPLIGVVDQGLNLDDERLARTVWTNPGEIDGNGKNDDGYRGTNGAPIIDDVHGFNFATWSPRLFDPAWEFNHGSFVTSLIAGRSSGHPLDIVGVAPKAQIIMAAVSNYSSTIEALYYLMHHDVKVVNMSLAVDVPESEAVSFLEEANKIAIWDLLEEKGIIVVCAAGNESRDNDRIPVFPACLPRSNVISVLATDAAGRLGRAAVQHAGDDGDSEREWIPFSNYGNNSVDLGAPGSLMLGIPAADSVGLSDGTSFSAPLVTGAVALIWGQHPSWNYERVIRAVLESARPLPSLEGRCVTGGILDFEAALEWQPKESRP